MFDSMKTDPYNICTIGRCTDFITFRNPSRLRDNDVDNDWNALSLKTCL